MKQIYKILFSLCSTLIYATHSFKVFGADCTVLSSVPAGGIIALHYRGTDLDTNCDTWGFRGYVRLTDGKESDDYGAVYGCDTCDNGYEWTSSGGTFYIGSPAAQCDYVHDNCVAQTVVEAQCSTKADCVAKFGFSEMHSGAVNKSGTFAGYIYKDVDCIGGKCGFVLRSVACGALCANGYYSHCATMWSIAGSQGIDGCVRCPFPDAECTENCDWPVIGGGNSWALCELDPSARWADSTGSFYAGSGCAYYTE